MRPTRCVFYGDLYPNEECYDPGTAAGLRTLLKIRKNVASGPVTDYWEDRNYIGWVRRGQGDKICAVLISNADSCVPVPQSSKYGKLKMMGTLSLSLTAFRQVNRIRYGCLLER